MKLSKKDKEEIAKLVAEELKKKEEKRKVKEAKINRYRVAAISLVLFITIMFSIQFLNPLWQFNILKLAFSYSMEAFAITLAIFAMIDAIFIIVAKKFTYDIAFPWIRIDTAGMKAKFARMIKKIDENTYLVKNRIFPLFKFYRLHTDGHKKNEGLYAIDVACPNIVLKQGEFYAANEFDKFIIEEADIYKPVVLDEVTEIGEAVMNGVKGDFGLQKRKFNQGIPYQIIKKDENE